MFSAEAQHGCHRVVFEWGYTGLYLSKDILAMWSSAESQHDLHNYELVSYHCSYFQNERGIPRANTTGTTTQWTSQPSDNRLQMQFISDDAGYALPGLLLNTHVCLRLCQPFVKTVWLSCVYLVFVLVWISYGYLVFVPVWISYVYLGFRPVWLSWVYLVFRPVWLSYVYLCLGLCV